MDQDCSQDRNGAEAIREDSTPSRSPRVESVELDGQAVLYLESSNAMHVLNPTATVVWFCLDGNGTVSEIARDISDAFGADPETVKADVLRVVREFADDGLLSGFEVPPKEDGLSDAAPARSPGRPGEASPQVLGAPPET